MKKQGFNPFLPGWEYIPDGEPHVFGERVYLYGSHDRFDGDDYCQNNYVCWSAPVDDLSDWTFHGQIYDITTDPLNSEGKYCGYAPDCCMGPDGRFYLYYALNNHLAISVAVSDTPAGKFSFLGHMKTAEGRIYGTNEGDAYCFDPGVFVDDDGRVHLYMGFSPTDDMAELSAYLRRWRTEGCHHIEICSDMVTMKTEPLMVVPGKNIAKGTSFDGFGFFEAPSMRKYFGKYYFIYSTENYHELCYAISDNPTGPFDYKGRLVSNGDVGMEEGYHPKNHMGNNHGSLAEIKGKYYIFYHRHTNNTPYSRQACAEEIELCADRTFKQAEITSCGLNGGPLKAKGCYSTSIACNISAEMPDPPYLTQNGEDREEMDDQYIKNMTDGSYVGFKYFDFLGNDTIILNLIPSCKAEIEIYTDLDEKPCGHAIIEGSDCPISSFIVKTSIKKGIAPLYFKYLGDGSCNFISFELN